MGWTVKGPVYRLERVRKVYGGRCVLDIDELDIHRGEILAVVGPNGAGKSTLLRLLNFLEPLSSGKLYFAGQEASLPVASRLRRQVTMVFQRPLLLNGSVRSNVAYPLKLRRRHDASVVQEILERLDLAGMASSDVRELSGGEVQRVALARALVIEPSVLLLDEPSANLDPNHVEGIEAIIRSVRKVARTTIVLVTHQVHQARRLADRTAMLLGGKLIEVSEVRQFFEAPADARTTAFVRGDMVY